MNLHLLAKKRYYVNTLYRIHVRSATEFAWTDLLFALYLLLGKDLNGVENHFLKFDKNYGA